MDYLGTDSARLKEAQRLFEQFCEDLKQDSGKARVRLVSGIQVALREAFQQGIAQGHEDRDRGRD